MRRVISLWLPRFATDRLCHADPGRADQKWRDRPLALVLETRSRLQLTAVNRAAERTGLRPGMALANARALLPRLATAAAEPAEDARALAALAEWCGRYSPWTAVDVSLDTAGAGGGMGGGSGLWLDVTGCAHLFGGEAALLRQLCGRLAGRGFSCRAAIADTPGAAWAVARFASEPRAVVAPGETRAALAPLPVAGLRLSAATAAALHGLGLKRIGDLLDIPRAPLAARFGDAVARRLDAALGAVAEPISPRRPGAPLLARLAFAEPIGHADDIAAALDRLLGDLSAGLAHAGRGARRLTLALQRCDNTTQHVRVGTGRPSRDAGHLKALFAEHLDRIDPGFGIEAMTLAADVTEKLGASQAALADGEAGRSRDNEDDDDGIAALLDRLGNRLGARNVLRLAARASHIPERAGRIVPGGALARDACPARPQRQPRPPRLLTRPELIEAVAAADAPPVLFRWRRAVHVVIRAEGPERIAPEWWRSEAAESRDYYRIEDAEGRRFWLYREDPRRPGAAAAWYLHGLFG